MYPRRSPQAMRQRTSQPIIFPAPVAGWVANRALADPRSIDGPGAAVLDNYFPRSSTVKLRRGKVLYATLVESELPVTSLFSYRNGENRKLFGANETTIYDLTSVPAPESFELSTEIPSELLVTEDGDFLGAGSTDGLEVFTGLTGGNWSVVQFATTGGVYLIGVNGMDTGFIYDGTYFFPYVAGGVHRLDYDALTAPFTVGDTVTGGTSGATGMIYKIVETDATTGVLYLTSKTGNFSDNEIVSGGGGSATANGADVTAVPGITFESSGLTTADMIFVWTYKSRLWFIQKDSLNAWYMEDADAIGGMAILYPLAGVLPLGGSLVFGQTWSLETGAEGGLSEQCIFVSTQGEVAVYQGSDPSQADTWSKVGVYRIGTPLGNRAFFRGGGDLAIATSVGLVPLSKAISLDVTSLTPATVSYRIADAWQDAVHERGGINWQCELWPDQKMAVVAPPNTIGANNPVLFVSNTDTGAWCRFTNWYALCMEVFEDDLYFGSPDGKVFIANAGGIDEADTYTGTVMPLFTDNGSPSSLKIGKVARGVSRANGRMHQRVTMKVDYDYSTPPAPDATIGTGDAIWGIGKWGSSVWSQQTPEFINQDWQSAGGAGYALSLAYQVSSGSVAPLDDELIRLELTVTTAELVS